MMNRRIVLFLVGILTSLQALSQAITSIPVFPNSENEVTIIVDLKQVKDSRAAGLLGKTSDIFAWTWGGSNPNNRTAEFGPVGQSNFNQPFEPSRMTSLGNDRWSLKVKPFTYLNVPAGKQLAWMGVVVKNGNGSSQTEDLFVIMYDNKLQVAFKTPTEESFFVDAGTSIQVKAYASQKCTMRLSINGSDQSPVVNTDSLISTVGTGGVPGARRTVKITAQTATETATDEFTFVVKPIAPIVPLPSGLKDGINYLSDTKATLVLFAPNKSFVYAVGDFNNWAAGPASLMNKTPDGNRYWIELNGLTPEREYAFQYLVDGTIGVGDPYCEKILDRNNDRFIPSSTYPNILAFPTQAVGNVVSVLQTAQKPYVWKVPTFQRPAQENLVIYELLVRDFLATQNYRTLADTIPYLKRLGVNCVELMPIMEFAGNDSWGYNPIYYTAPDKAYGTPNDLKAFIDKCHQNGIAVVLDMVLNQADYEFPYVKMYWAGNQPSKDSPMFNQQATHPFSVFFDFNHESKATQDLTDRICEFWIKEYKFDGYRFDLSKGFTQKDAGGDVGRWSSYDATRIALWKRIYDKIRGYDPSAYVILEHFADDVEERELAAYGMMLWGNHNGDFRNVIKGNNVSLQRLSYRDRNFSKPHIIGYMESHDEERVMWEALNNGQRNGSYNIRDLGTAANRIKAAAAILMLTPGPKMMWQFGEMGYDVAIDENGRTGRKPIRWEYLQNEDRLKLQKVFAELIKLKVGQPAFRSLEFSFSTADRFKYLSLNHPSMRVHVMANFDTQDYLGRPNLPQAGKWFDYFTGQEVNINSTDDLIILKPGEFHVYTTAKLPTPELGLVPWPAYTRELISSLPNQLIQGTKVYPNPAQQQVQVEIQNEYLGEVTVLLQDLTGRIISETTLQKDSKLATHQLDISPLTKGIYLLDLRQGDQRSVQKVVKL